ncbi:MAG: translation initiation factor IF-2 N-terminal domain-containing protein [Clostridium sp.]|uniref:translation initiation factor IF-2 N-terminal domain-containing protein n=1 Tax=Clostridium sp. TaxID=1506 RepID=UPI0025C46A05|nr:translation initiation factor IF-2 N-terminal domain-containing protein [Clostridium sp.]MCE5220081.1 translation initiation factor IF-2 N-terminal domain-containing protein [Clostridium sp.]
MKVFELAKELNVESKELLEVIQGLDIDVKSHLSNLEDNQVEKIKETLNLTDLIDLDTSSKKSDTNKQSTKQFKPDLNRMICLKNIASGKLIYVSKRQIGYKIEWEKPGDTNYIELGEFINLKNSDSRFVTEPWVRIIEDDEIEILKYANIFKHYEEILGLKNVSDILRLDFNKFKKKFDKLPSGYKNSVVEQAAQMIKNGELDSIKIKNYIEKEMGIELDILLQSDSKPVDNSINIK